MSLQTTPSRDRYEEARRYYQSGAFAESESVLQSMLREDDSHLPARVLLGVILAKTGRIAEAQNYLQSVVSIIPDQLDCLVWLSQLARMRHDYAAALSWADQAAAAHPDSAAAHNARGLALLSLRQSDGAMQAFDRARILEPFTAAAYHNLGLALRLRDDAFEACRVFAKALSLEPRQEVNYLELFRQQQIIAAWPAAIETMERGLKLLPRSVAIAEALGLAYVRVGQKEKAEDLFKKVWAIQPGVCQSYAIFLQEEGRFAESVELLEESLKIRPCQGTAFYCLAEAKAFELDGKSWIPRVEAMLTDPDLNNHGKMFAHYALGKAYDKQGESESAIFHFDRANEIAFQTFNAGRRLDPEVTKRNVEISAEMFPSERLQAMIGHGTEDQTPIFIVGMIRSGTTLLDQILSSHPQIASAGEQPYWKLEGGRVTHHWNRHGIDPADLPLLANNYLTVLRSVAGDADRIIDKMPLNYEHLGLIHACFPKAKILHIRRSAVDTCLSIYMTHFGGGPSFAYKQENIVAYYEAYMERMEHWRKVLPNESFFELDYEDLVADREPLIRHLLEFCELPWHEGCLHHEENTRAVSTPSRWQARQPIYKAAVDRWRRYEPWLGALLNLRDVSHPTTTLYATKG